MVTTVKRRYPASRVSSFFWSLASRVLGDPHTASPVLGMSITTFGSLGLVFADIAAVANEFSKELWPAGGAATTRTGFAPAANMCAMCAAPWVFAKRLSCSSVMC